MIYLYLVFRFVEGRYHGNQLILVKCHERRLIPLAFFALSFENELQYHCLNVHVNSGVFPGPIYFVAMPFGNGMG